MKSIILWLLIGCAVLAQPRTKSFNWEILSFPDDSVYSVYLTYRISYDLLVFTKDNGSYSAGVKCFAEVFRNDTVVARTSGQADVQTDDYELTNSSENYLQGFVEFVVPEGKYKVLPEFELKYTDRIANLPATQFELEAIDSLQVMDPIIILGNKSEDGYLLSNYGSVLPLSNGSGSLLLPVMNHSSKSIRIKITKKDSLVTELGGELVFTGIPEILSDTNGLILKKKSGYPAEIGYYLIDKLGNNLDEGEYKISPAGIEDSASFSIRWVNKPRSLFDLEYAIEILSYIDKESTVRDLLSNKEENYYTALKDYWKKYDRNKQTAFNEVMNEFYSRVDTADLEFNTAGDDRGSQTDRGRIFIKYGRPDKIERSYYDDNSVAELWIYNGINRRFLFKDSTGLGEYILAN